jgi:UDP-glucose 4-epimerase
MDIKNRLKVAYANRPVLITGGASFIGSHLAELLVDADAAITVADDLSSGQLENLAAVQSRVKFLKGDLREPEFAKIACNNQEMIFHLAASHGGRGYIETHPVECTNNMLLDHAVFAAATGAGASKIIFASSACVYPTNLQSDKESRLLLKEIDANF